MDYSNRNCSKHIIMRYISSHTMQKEALLCKISWLHVREYQEIFFMKMFESVLIMAVGGGGGGVGWGGGGEFL